MNRDIFSNKNKIAHRGVHEKYTENTLPAFKEAIKRNYAIELDIQLTKDEEIIVFHDQTLKRLFKVNKAVSSLTLNEIKKYSIIPTLEETLKVVQGKVPILIEIKWVKKTDLLIKLLQKQLKNYSGEILIMSFYSRPLYYLKKYHLKYQKGYLIHRFLPSYFFIQFFLKINPFDFDFLAVDLNLLKDPLILSLRKKYYILGYTINTYQEYYQYKEYANNFIWDSYKS